MSWFTMGGFSILLTLMNIFLVWLVCLLFFLCKKLAAKGTSQKLIKLLDEKYAGAEVDQPIHDAYGMTSTYKSMRFHSAGSVRYKGGDEIFAQNPSSDEIFAQSE